jgi:hypothetical protein
MKFLKNLRATEVVEDPAVVARLNGIALRSRAEVSLYEAVKKAQRTQGAPWPKKAAP